MSDLDYHSSGGGNVAQLVEHQVQHTADFVVKSELIFSADSSGGCTVPMCNCMH